MLRAILGIETYEERISRFYMKRIRSALILTFQRVVKFSDARVSEHMVAILINRLMTGISQDELSSRGAVDTVGVACGHRVEWREDIFGYVIHLND